MSPGVGIDPFVAHCDVCHTPAIGGGSDGRLYCDDCLPENEDESAGEALTDGGVKQPIGGFTAFMTVYRHNPAATTAIHRGLAPDTTAGELLEDDDLGIDDWHRAGDGSHLFKYDHFGPLRSITEVGPTDDDLPGSSFRLTWIDGDETTVRNAHLGECEAVSGGDRQ